MELVRVVICGLAGWRLASLLVAEAGPWDVFERLRTRVGVPNFGEVASGLIPGMFSCVWCMSVWTVALCWLLWEVHWAIPGALAAMALAITAEVLNRR